jgi:hypothetical protein
LRASFSALQERVRRPSLPWFLFSRYARPPLCFILRSTVPRRLCFLGTSQSCPPLPVPAHSASLLPFPLLHCACRRSVFDLAIGERGGVVHGYILSLFFPPSFSCFSPSRLLHQLVPRRAYLWCSSGMRCGFSDYCGIRPSNKSISAFPASAWTV